MQLLHSKAVQQTLKLLWRLPDPHTGFIDYRISVENPLPVDGIKKLVCEVLADQHLESFAYVNVYLYRSVSEYSTYVVDVELTKKLVAMYQWNRNLVELDEARRLTVLVNPDGKPYPFEDRPRIRFDHQKECDKLD